MLYVTYSLQSYNKRVQFRQKLNLEILNTRTALFWAINQQVVVIYYRRFGTNFRSHLPGSKIQGSWILET